MNVAFISLALMTSVSLIRDPVFDSDACRNYSRELLWTNRVGAYTGTEDAAFIVDRGDGTLECVLWPRTYRHDAQAYRGALPRNTIAIIHTHPIRSPMPSPQDQMEADRLGIPIYALTPFWITKAAPNLRWPVIVHRGEWAPRPVAVGQCKMMP